MKIKTTGLDLTPDLPLFFDLTAGSINLIYDDKNYAEISFPDAGLLEPDIKLSITGGKSSITALNIIDDETDITLHLPANTKETTVSTGNGDVTVRGLRTHINITAFDGDVTIVDSSGTIKAESFAGFTNLNSFSGNLNISSTNGPVRIKNWYLASGFVNSANGTISTGINSMAGEIKLHSKNSRIYIGISGDCHASVIAKATEVVNYLEQKTDEITESSELIKIKSDRFQINAESEKEKIIIAGLKELEKISPDMEEIFKELDDEFAKSFDNLIKKTKETGKKIGLFGKMISNNIKVKQDKNGQPPEGNSEMKMEIIKMLKEGKITAEEAEKLLKAL